MVSVNEHWRPLWETFCEKQGTAGTCPITVLLHSGNLDLIGTWASVISFYIKAVSTRVLLKLCTDLSSSCSRHAGISGSTSIAAFTLNLRCRWSWVITSMLHRLSPAKKFPVVGCVLLSSGLGVSGGETYISFAPSISRTTDSQSFSP